MCWVGQVIFLSDIRVFFMSDVRVRHVLGWSCNISQ